MYAFVSARDFPAHSSSVPRTNIANYTGASGRIDIADVERLGSAFAVQPKHDGAYCHLELDAAGRIAQIRSRTGACYGQELTDGLLGEYVGAPHAVLAGELTAHTTAGNAEAERIGQRRVHLFDLVLGEGGQPVHDLAYETRRDMLWRMQTEVVEQSRRELVDVHERARERATGRYTDRLLRGWQLTPIVEQVSVSRASELWDRALAGDLEGLVVVSRRAKARARGAKRKCKPVRTLDALVLDVGPRIATCLWGSTMFTVHKATRNVQRGDMLEIRFDGLYDTGLPRFPRIQRVRYDLMVED